MPPADPRVSSTCSMAVSMSTVAGPGVGVAELSAGAPAGEDEGLVAAGGGAGAGVAAACGLAARRQLASPRLRRMMAAVRETARWALMRASPARSKPAA